MINQDLLTYIENEISRGTPKNTIQSNLLSNGWNEKDVTEAFSNIVVKNYNPITTVSPINNINVHNIPQPIARPLSQTVNYIQTDVSQSKKPHAFILSIIILIICAIGGGGAYVYLNQGLSPIYKISAENQIDTTSSTSKTTLLPIQKIENDKSSVVLLVEQNIADSIKPELNTWSQDISREFGFNTITKFVQPTDDVLVLKDYILNEYKNGNLAGILIVGNVPTGYFYHPDVDTSSVFNSQGAILSDSIYQDILNACTYSSDKKAFSYKDPHCQTGNTIPPYWIGRLTPNSSTQDSATLLKDYFDRDHEYRTGKFSYQKNILIYSPIFSDSKSSDKQSDVNTVKDFSLFDEYGSNQINFIDPWNTNSDQLYLNELHKSHQYEFLYFNGHGLPTFHQKNVKSENIGTVSTFLGLFASCSVGRFTTKDYLAGQYLFSDSLIIVAPSVPVFATSQAPKNLSYPLVIGKPGFEALRVSPISTAVNMFGDPTLQMRYGNVKSDRSKPVINLDQKKIIFSDSQQDVTLNIKNSGDTKLFFKTIRQFNTQNYTTNEILSSFSSLVGPPITDELNGKYSGIAPNVEAPIKFFILPWNESSYKYTGSVFFLSNDPITPLIEIPFEIQNK